MAFMILTLPVPMWAFQAKNCLLHYLLDFRKTVLMFRALSSQCNTEMSCISVWKRNQRVESLNCDYGGSKKIMIKVPFKIVACILLPNDCAGCSCIIRLYWCIATSISLKYFISYNTCRYGYFTLLRCRRENRTWWVNIISEYIYTCIDI